MRPSTSGASRPTWPSATSRSPAARSTSAVAHALAAIKRHAAAVNAALGVRRRRRRRRRGDRRRRRRVEAGELDDQFPIDVFQTGSGTSTNMNVNEVLATLATRRAATRRPPERPRQRLAVVERHRADGDPHRRRPRARRRASTRPSSRLIAALRCGCGALRRRRQGRAHPPDGRHAGDPRPGGRRLGRAARRGARRARAPTSTRSASCRSAAPRSAPASTRPTGFAAGRRSPRSPPRPGCRCGRRRRPDGRSRAVRARWPRRRPALRGIAVALTKIANDIRLLASGPAAGLGRAAPARAAGRVVDHAGQGQPGAVRVGQPGRGPGVRQRRHRRLRRVAGHPRAEHVPAGDGRRPARVGHAARQRLPACSPTGASPASRPTSSAAAATPSARPALATALNPIIGYARAAELVTAGLAEGRSIIDVVIEAGVLEADEARRVLDPLRLDPPRLTPIEVGHRVSEGGPAPFSLGCGHARGRPAGRRAGRWRRSGTSPGATQPAPMIRSASSR